MTLKGNIHVYQVDSEPKPFSPPVTLAFSVSLDTLLRNQDREAQQANDKKDKDEAGAEQQ